jgi:hypothetical protein
VVLQPFDAGSEGQIGGDGADLDAPALATLPGGSFALLYSQGRGTKRRVRMQKLSATLASEGAPVDVTVADPAFRGAAVGSLFWVADRLLAFQFLVRDEGYALSVASLECDRR